MAGRGNHHFGGRLHVGRAFDKTTKNDQKKCVSKINEFMFGYVGDATVVSLAGLGETLGAHADLLGSAANVIPKDDRTHANCQQEVQKGLIQYLDGLAADANSAKKACLKGKKVAQCRTPSELAAAMTADGKKGPKGLIRWNGNVAKKRSDTTGMGLVDLAPNPRRQVEARLPERLGLAAGQRRRHPPVRPGSRAHAQRAAPSNGHVEAASAIEVRHSGSVPLFRM